MTKSPSYIAVALAATGLCLFGATVAAPLQNKASPGPQLHITTILKDHYNRLEGSLLMFAEDDTIDLTCSIHGYTPHNLSWWEDDSLLLGFSSGKGNYQSYSKLNLTGLSSRDDGRQLTCKVDDKEFSRTVELRGKASQLPTLHLNITIIVRGRLETLEGSEVMFEEDSNLQITCFIQGFTLHTLAWWEDGNLLDAMSNTDDVHTFSKVNLSGLSSRDDGRQLTCEVDDTKLSRTVELRKKVPESSKPPSQPLHITIAVGGNYRRLQGNMVWFSENRNFNLTCFIQDQTFHNLSWWEDGMLLDGINVNENYQSYSKLSLTGLPSKDDGRQLTCKVDDMEISRTVELRRKESPNASLNLTIIVNGTNTLEDSPVWFADEDSLELNCSIKGNRNRTMSWWEKDTLLDGKNSKDDFMSYSKVILTDLSTSDDGRQLTCEVDSMELSRVVELRRKAPKKTPSASTKPLPPTPPATTTPLPPTTPDATTSRTKPIATIDVVISSILVVLAVVSVAIVLLVLVKKRDVFKRTISTATLVKDGSESPTEEQEHLNSSNSSETQQPVTGGNAGD